MCAADGLYKVIVPSGMVIALSEAFDPEDDDSDDELELTMSYTSYAAAVAPSDC
jgi:hypothetical protein